VHFNKNNVTNHEQTNGKVFGTHRFAATGWFEHPVPATRPIRRVKHAAGRHNAETDHPGLGSVLTKGPF
jgi:hypothetical protein